MAKAAQKTIETPETEEKAGAAVERAAPLNIHEARLHVYEVVGYVQKTGTLDTGGKGGKYKYAGEADLIAALRPAMVEAGIVFHCEAIEVMKHEEIRKVSVWEGKETVKTSFLVTGLFTFRFTHVGSGTHIDVKALGEGNDSLDKASYKAMTGALKYALRQTFIIETGDDPDDTVSGDGSVEKHKGHGSGNGRPPHKGKEPEKLAVYVNNACVLESANIAEVVKRLVDCMKARSDYQSRHNILNENLHIIDALAVDKKNHIPPDLVVDRWAGDDASGSHRAFLFRQDVSTMFRRQIGEK